MDTQVNICFEIPDTHECDQVFKWMTDNPKDIWNFDKRVQKGFHTQEFETNFLLDARWSDDDILTTQVTRLQLYGNNSNIIQYEATLKRYAKDPKVLVDLMRRCKSVQEESFGGWKIHAWYLGAAWPWHYSEHIWTADEGNVYQPRYNRYGGFNENVLDPKLPRHPMSTMRTLLRQMEQMI